MNNNKQAPFERVVITGMGCVSPFGTGATQLWQSLLQGENGIKAVQHLPLSGDIVAIAASRPCLQQAIKRHPNLSQYTSLDASVQGFFLAVEEAVQQAELDLFTPEYRHTACMIADRTYSPANDMAAFLPHLRHAQSEGAFSPSAYWQQLTQCDQLAQRKQVSEFESINHFTARYYGLTGPHLSIGTACASGNNAIGEAFEKIRRGKIRTALAGGAYDFDINAMIGFTRIGALSQNPDPETACAPFSQTRSGFVMGSGCAVLVIESLSCALARGATILAEVTGYASFSDGYRATDPDPEASGASRTLRGALAVAGLDPEQISYINAHGTSTQMNDKIESLAIKKVFQQAAYKVPISSTKSMIGHGIMAAGAIEAVACIQSIRSQMIHGTRNYQQADPELDLDYVPETSRDLKVEHVLSNNFGFGGQNASVIFSAYSGAQHETHR
ncbi:beta-ketoacyl-[acyl-carrier-protein] synthase family protein [Motilimonas pumila]|uniref:Beta-ketoacyl-[acyl-carrier-protein] synthase family protein n=1 Tax=Motilimonas pumila TaxID=2303987 RepID=A0A418YIH4_9GAMM|nr:beta-ketoacyl-[acyl-carrier-protein] synthase family protein [Motilimonas pumila]RJG50438.1 beta-ketoacyl-[acyl-carrier-protein] synthase family protein [Motilimonas pumila]